MLTVVCANSAVCRLVGFSFGTSGQLVPRPAWWRIRGRCCETLHPEWGQAGPSRRRSVERVIAAGRSVRIDVCLLQEYPFTDEPLWERMGSDSLSTVR